MGADRIRPRTASAQQKLTAQPQQLKRRAAASRYSTAGAGTHQNAFVSQQMPQQAHVSRSSRYDDEVEPEFKAAKRVQSADLLSQLKLSSLRKYCRVHKIPCEDQPKDKNQILPAILFHWKHQAIVDDKQVLKKFAVALHENCKREQE